MEELIKRQSGVVVFPYTAKGLEWIERNYSAPVRRYLQSGDINARNFIRSGARILLATDGSLFAPEAMSDPKWGRMLAEESVGLIPLDTGHFYWLRAMEEKGFEPMEMLKAATRNIALGYGQHRDLGTLEPGKIADILLLDKNPLESAEHYRSIHMVFKSGVAVDRDALPVRPMLTRPAEFAAEEVEESFDDRCSSGFGEDPA
jgi:hypothetical protein